MNVIILYQPLILIAWILCAVPLAIVGRQLFQCAILSIIVSVVGLLVIISWVV